MPSQDARFRSGLLQWAAPSWQVGGILTLGQFYRFFDGALEVALDRFALHAPAQEIGPEKFAEWRGVLGKATGAPQLPASERNGSSTRPAMRLGISS